MTIELDHFFVLTDPGAPQADILSTMRMIEGPRNNHPGQGTANRRFFFANSALELLYVSDAVEAESGPASRMRIVDRARNSTASPFGLIVRSDSVSTDAPFPGWRYCPEYFQAGQCFHIGENSELLDEPSCICMPHNLPVANAQLRLANAQMILTELRLSVPVDQPSQVLETIAGCDLVSLSLNEPHRMELVFNAGAEGKSKDLVPELALIVRW